MYETVKIHRNFRLAGKTITTLKCKSLGDAEDIASKFDKCIGFTFEGELRTDRELKKLREIEELEQKKNKLQGKIETLEKKEAEPSDDEKDKKKKKKKNEKKLKKLKKELKKELKEELKYLTIASYVASI